MGENTCRQCNWKGLNLQNILTTHTTQQKKTQRAQLINGQKTWIDFSPGKIYGWPMGTWKKKILNMTNYERNANQNYSEVGPHTSQNGQHQWDHK